jgi:hypothetical protein
VSEDGRSCEKKECADREKLGEDGFCQPCDDYFITNPDNEQQCILKVCDNAKSIVSKEGTCSACEEYTHPDEDK